MPMSARSAEYSMQPGSGEARAGQRKAAEAGCRKPQVASSKSEKNLFIIPPPNNHIRDGPLNLQDSRIAIIGLGYVGLPLLVEFAKQYPTLGFDIQRKRIEQLRQHQDLTLEVSEEELKGATHARYSDNPDDLRDCNVYIFTVPT